MAGNYVRSALLGGADALIRELGGRPLTIARRAGVPAAALKDPDIPLPGRTAYAFLERAAELCDCPAFGLRLGSRTPMASVIGPLWVLLRSARTLEQMFVDLSANFDVYTAVATVAVEKLPDGLLLSWSSTAGQTDSEVQMAEFAIAVCCEEVRRQVAPRWRPRHAEFRHAAPRDLSAHRAVLGPHLSFNRERNTLFVEQALAQRPLPTGAAPTHALAGPLLRREEDVAVPSLVTHVESVVRSVLPYAPCTLRDVARALGLPVRTLQHRLEAAGQGFKPIKDRVRADLAMKYLRHSQLGIAEIADILGYSEPSAFSRSFRRWHGRTARAVRQDVQRG